MFLNLIICIGLCILLYCFSVSYEIFDLARHGVNFEFWPVLLLVGYCLALLYYLRILDSGSGIRLDAFNVFILLLSFLILPGAVLAPSIDDSYIAHYMILLCSYMILGMGIIHERLLPSVAIAKLVAIRLGPILVSLSVLISTICFVLVFFLDGFDRGGAVNTIIQIVLGTDVELGVVNQSRTDYYSTFGVKDVLVNYAGGVVGPFFSLVACVAFFDLKAGRKYSFFGLILVGFLVLYPLLFALGSGSRLTLLKLLLVYGIVFYYRRGFRPFSLRAIRLALTFFLLVIMTTAILQRGMQGETFEENVVLNTQKAIARIFLGKGGSTMSVYDYYPKREPFEYGVPIVEKLVGINLDNKPPIANKMFAYLTGGKLGTAGPNSFGDAYASFGFSGQIIFVFIYGPFLLWLRRVEQKNNLSSPLRRVYWSYVALGFGYVAYSDIASFKSIGLVYIIIIYLIIKGLINITARNKKIELRHEV